LADRPPKPAGFGVSHYFIIRRLHSLCGLVPVGVFLGVHLMIGASVLVRGASGAEYQRTVGLIQGLGSILAPIEVFGILLPLAFHALLGLQITYCGEVSIHIYRYGGNVRFALQRIAGIIAFVFILFHVWQMHWLGEVLGGGVFDPLEAPGTTAAVIQSSWWVAPVYAVGVVASVYHLAAGIWTALITWGVAIRPRTQRVCGYLCTVFGIVLACIGLAALWGFRTLDLSTAEAGIAEIGRPGSPDLVSHRAFAVELEDTG